MPAIADLSILQQYKVGNPKQDKSSLKVHFLFQDIKDYKNLKVDSLVICSNNDVCEKIIAKPEYLNKEVIFNYVLASSGKKIDIFTLCLRVKK